MAQWVADSMLIAIVGFIGYVLCIAVERKTIGQMVILVAVLLFANKTIVDLKPVIDQLNAVKDDLNTIKEVKDKIGGAPILDWAPGTGILKDRQGWVIPSK
ncbi:MAG: hypothetical protein P4L59_13480 [Desulfosporosinus sp.]|nr:hypothetical protein [Desulfosporosinus sp.]